MTLTYHHSVHSMGYLGCIEYESNHEEYFGDCRYNGETTVMMKNFVDQVRITNPNQCSVGTRSD
jgi:hypothetical protein